MFSFHTCLQTCRPVITFLREVDSDVPCMGKVFYRCFQLQQKLAAVEWLEEKEQKWLSDQWQHRWNQLHSDMHACGKQLVCVQSMHRMHSIDGNGFLQATCATLSTANMLSGTSQRWQQGFGGWPGSWCLLMTSTSST